MRRFTSCAATLTLLLPLLRTDVAYGDWPDTFRRDANLYDVCFADAQTGWAVGDRGTILQTSDGGQNWRIQTSRVDIRLESVHALDAKQAWAVGGYTVPHTHRSKGVLLQTRDGGENWVQIEDHFLPWLTQVHFMDSEYGYALGLPSAMFPSAVFRTSDGGKHWTPWPGTSHGFSDADFGSDGSGLALQQGGKLIRIEPGGLEAVTTNLPPGAKRLRLTSPATVIACGFQGQLVKSTDRGLTWSRPPTVSLDEFSEFDWRTIGHHGRDIWVAGSPGTRILHSADEGDSWVSYNTGQYLPLNAIGFVDAQRGWAVGELGTVLVTSDGGRTWTQQTDVPRRLALMAVTQRAASVPWELLAQVAGGDGFVAGVQVLSGPSPLTRESGTVPIARRLHQAVSAVSGSTAHIIQSIPENDNRLGFSAEQIRKRSDMALQGDSRALLTEYLVRQIRLYRPEMIVIADDIAENPGEFDATRDVVRRAVQWAAEPAHYQHHMTHAGLEPWLARFSATLTHSESDRTYQVTRNRLALPLGRTISDLADDARAAMTPEYVLAPDRFLYEISGAEGAIAANRRGISRLFKSSTLVRGDRMHRLDLALKEDFRTLHQHAQQRRTVESLLRSSADISVAQLQQLSQLSRELPQSDQGDLLYQTSARLATSKHQTEAISLLEQLTRQSPNHTLAESARLELLIKAASLEGLLHWTLPTEYRAAATAAGVSVPPPNGVQPATFVTPTQQNPEAVREVSFEQRQQRENRALEIAKSIQENQPDFYFEPMVRFPLNALLNRLGRTDEAHAYWRRQITQQSDRIWKSRAETEMSLAQPGAREMASHPCRLTTDRPYLDGKLDDVVWSGAAIPLDADTTANSFLTELRWAWDSQFLFLAASCESATGGRRTGTDAVSSDSRQRDVDLSGRDRLLIRLDIDRDYATYWNLAIDDRGWANDALNQDSSWNPKWYLAHSQADSGWTIEAAIPWNQLAPNPPQPGDAWAIGIERLLPETGRQTFGEVPVSGAGPHRIGLLIFE